MARDRLTRIAVLTLRILLGFGVVSSAIGAVMGIFLGGAGVPREYLDGSPFSSFVVPGVILGLVVGGTQAAMAVIGEFSFLQAVYFGVGVLELIAVVALLGIAPRILPAWAEAAPAAS